MAHWWDTGFCEIDNISNLLRSHGLSTYIVNIDGSDILMFSGGARRKFYQGQCKIYLQFIRGSIKKFTIIIIYSQINNKKKIFQYFIGGSRPLTPYFPSRVLMLYMQTTLVSCVRVIFFFLNRNNFIQLQNRNSDSFISSIGIK